MRPFLVWPSPLKSSLTASKAALPVDPNILSPKMLSDTSANGDISIAFKKGIGTVFPAAYIAQSYKKNTTETQRFIVELTKYNLPGKTCSSRLNLKPTNIHLETKWTWLAWTQTGMLVDLKRTKTPKEQNKLDSIQMTWNPKQTKPGLVQTWIWNEYWCYLGCVFIWDKRQSFQFLLK